MHSIDKNLSIIRVNIRSNSMAKVEHMAVILTKRSQDSLNLPPNNFWLGS
jgi:hypothetical protein